MNRTQSSRLVPTLLPLLVVPITAMAVTAQFDSIPDFVRGLISGISIVLLLAFLVCTGVQLGIAKREAEDRRLDDLEPLKGLPRDEDGQR